MVLELPLLGLERRLRGGTRSGRQNRSIPFFILSRSIYPLILPRDCRKNRRITGKNERGIFSLRNFNISGIT
jgi:hypothetical protein